MTAQDRDRQGEKADRALVLSEQGIGRSAIAERLGISPSHVNGMIQRAKQRREKTEGVVEA